MGGLLDGWIDRLAYRMSHVMDQPLGYIWSEFLRVKPNLCFDGIYLLEVLENMVQLIYQFSYII